MASSSDTLVEIPPPEASPVETHWWGLPAMSLALIIGLVAFVSVTTPRLPALEWTRQTGPPSSVNLDSLVATDDGFAVLSGMTVDGVLLWSLEEGSIWSSQVLEGAPSQLAASEDSLIAYGGRTGRFVQPDGDMWLESGDVLFPDEVRSRQGSGRPSLIGSDDGLLAMSLFGDVWWSSDGSEFSKVVADPRWGPGVERPFDSACRPPSRTSPDVPPLVETDSGFVAMVSSNPVEPFGIWPVCEPLIWRSDDARTWTASDSMLDDGAYVYDLAWRDGRFTAVGGFGIGEPAAWTSEDGRHWEPIPSFSRLLAVDLFTVEAGPAGWVVLGRDGEADSVGWTSMDGLCWESLPWYIGGGDAAVSRRHILIVDRTSFPELWLGTMTGGSGSCG